MTQSELMKKIQELAFVKCELELFLDTHPRSAVALENYRDCVEALDTLRMQYAEKHGPVCAAESYGDTWSWAEGPWPWHHEFPNNLENRVMPRNIENREGRR